MSTVVPIVSDITLDAAQDLYDSAQAHLVEVAQRSVRILVKMQVPDATAVHLTRAGNVTISTADLDVDADPTILSSVAKAVTILRTLKATPCTMDLNAPSPPESS